MDSTANPFDRFATIEPTFGIDGPWRGHFDLDGRHVHCSMDQTETLRLAVPITGGGSDLVHLYGCLLLPVKVVAGPTLVAEMPSGDHAASIFTFLRDALRRSMSVLESRVSGTPAAEPQTTSLLPQLRSILEESALAWEEDNGVLSTKTAAGKVTASVHATSVAFRSPLAHLGRASPTSLEALTDFVLAMNARFCLVRGTFVSDTLVGEVALPVEGLTPVIVNQAVRGIGTIVAMARKACLALVDRQVAEQYLEFHTHRKDAYADTHH